MRCQGRLVCSCKQRGGYDMRSSRYPCRGTSGSNNSASMEVGEASCTGLLPYTPSAATFIVGERRMLCWATASSSPINAPWPCFLLR